MPTKKHSVATKFFLGFICMLLLLFEWLSLSVQAIDVSGHGVTGLSVSYTDNSQNTSYASSGWKAAEQSLSCSDTTGKKWGLFGSTYYYKATELTLTNNSEADKTLSFHYNVILNGGLVTIVQDEKRTNIEGESDFSVFLKNGASITIETKTNATTDKTTSVTLTGIKLAVEDIQVTFAAPQTGSYSVDGTLITADQVMTRPSTTVYTLSAVPSDNYVFDGWYVGNSLYSADNPCLASFATTSTVSAKFSVDPLYSVTTINGDYTKDQLVSINSRYHHDKSTELITAQLATDQFSFYSVAATVSDTDWDMQRMPDLIWTVSGSTVKIDKTVTANGEYCATAGNSWSYANMVSDVIRVHAKQDCLISFKFSDTIGIPNPDKRAKLPYLRVYQSTNGSETYDSLYNKALKYQADNLNDQFFEYSVPAGEYLYIFTNGYTEQNSFKIASYATHTLNFKATISNFTVTPTETKYTQTVHFQDNLGNSLAGGAIQINKPEYTYSVDNSGVIAGLEYLENTELNLSVTTTPNHYRFLGWRVNDSIDLVCTPTYEYTLNANTKIDAVFVPNYVSYDTDSNIYQYLDINGNPVNCNGEYVARNENATKFYTTLAEGFADTTNTSGVVVLLGNLTMDGETAFTVPENKTLVVPNTMDTICASWDSAAKQYIPHTSQSGGGQYAVFTVNNDLIVNGALLIAGYQYDFSGSPIGNYGTMTVAGTVTVTKDAALYGYGLVNGSGTIYAKGDGTIGAQIHELCEVLDKPHPAKMNSLVEDKGGYDIVPFNIIYINTIEAKTVYEPGATLDGHFSVRYDNVVQNTLRIIDKSASLTGLPESTSLFAMTKGTLTKYFCTQDKQILFRIDEGAEVETGVFKIAMEVTFGITYPVEFSSSDFVMPLSSGWQLKVAGNFTIDHNYKMLPGAKLDVESGGVMTISNSGSLVFYRLNDYDYRSNPSDSKTPMGFCSPGYPVNMSRHGDFNSGNVGSAKLNVDGTIIANGGLYVTTQTIDGMTLIDNGYNNLTGFGTIEMGSRETPLEKIYENLTYSQDIYSVNPCEVPVAPMKGLNPDAETDTKDNYQELTGTVCGYTNSNGLNVWGTDPCIAGHIDTNGFSEEGFLECDVCGIPLAKLAAVDVSADSTTELSMKFLVHSGLEAATVKFGNTILTAGQYIAKQDGEGRMVYTVPVASGEMTKEMTVSFGDAPIIVGDTSPTSVTYTVADYAKAVLTMDPSENQKQWDLVAALLSYGDYARTYFLASDEGKEEPLYSDLVDLAPPANVFTELSVERPSIAETKLDAFGISPSGDDIGIVLSDEPQNAFLDAAISLQVYFTLQSGSIEEYTFRVQSVNGTAVVKAHQVGETNEYHVDILNIPAAYLDDTYTITVTNSSGAKYTVETSVLAYLAAMLKDETTSENLANLAKAMYLYNQKADAFFGT